MLALSCGVIGWTIGLRFTPAILGHAARVFPHVFASILILICARATSVQVTFAGIAPLTACLAISPKGADFVAIISASTPGEVPFVMSMHR